MSLSNRGTAGYLLMTVRAGKKDIKQVTNGFGQTFKVGDGVYFPDPLDDSDSEDESPKSTKNKKSQQPRKGKHLQPLMYEGVVVAFVNHTVALVRYDKNAWSKAVEYRHAIPVDFLQKRRRTRI
jgi:hypothetical protein